MGRGLFSDVDSSSISNSHLLAGLADAVHLWHVFKVSLGLKRLQGQIVLLRKDELDLPRSTFTML
jgi:hypothetical protein